MKYGIILVVIGFFVLAQARGLFFTPPDQLMGEVQRLMYIHVPAAWNAFIAFFITFVGSIGYLWRKTPVWDRLAASSAEVGVVLTAMTVCLGAIWGRPTWGVWWTWDARLTTTAILLFLYLGFLAIRAFIDDRRTRARVSAPIGILIFLNVPIVYFSVKWWRTLHQVQSSPSTMDLGMVTSLRLNALALLAVLVTFLYWRMRLERRRQEREEQLAMPPAIADSTGGGR
ncbi:MAG: cytochrome c biogenesis protein CcsA [Deltaproteobacteria bacterium]|nr:cytochrome c biogenesis protein CcsA [Deltaproteobacteria bacterium]